ncbi:MAG: bifunctional diaminohydroxyphosphoribosylaminopyrimidine deaminase/5-amino-6-(5-phosphoribosylamino)uracil reductase RibD [Candidatus Omnitrophota bacterium]
MRNNLQEKYMTEAMHLALKAKGNTSPNPLVGALVVKKNKVIGRAYHRKAGLAHAEALALEQANRRAKGATLYVTLEPCAHFGRTSPCTQAIIKSGVSKVIIGMKDPNPIVNGKGIKILKSQGLTVLVGFLEKELGRMNEVYVKYIRKRLPFMVVKVAQSLDARIATCERDSKWITSQESRNFTKRLRNDFDAIMVGINTLLADEPGLEPERPKERFYKVIVDSKLRTPIDAKILAKDANKVIIATTKLANEDKVKYLCAKNVRVWILPDKDGLLDLCALAARLAESQITSVLVEGGGSLIGSLFDDGLVDKVMFFIAPKIIGGKDALSSVEGRGARWVKDAIGLKDLNIKKIGEDFLVEAYVK